jgi:hypothetical protein
MGPCVAPPYRPSGDCTETSLCLPFTGGSVNVLLPYGVMLLLVGALILALGNLLTQTRRFVLQV